MAEEDDDERGKHRIETPPIPARPPRRSTKNSEHSATENVTETQPVHSGNESSDSEAAPEDIKRRQPKKTVSFDEVSTSVPTSIHKKIIAAAASDSDEEGQGAEYTAESLTEKSDIDGASLRRVSTPSELTIEDEEGIVEENKHGEDDDEALKLSSSKPVSVPHRPGEIDTSDPVLRASVIDDLDIGRSQRLVDEAIGRKTTQHAPEDESSSSSSSTMVSESKVPKLSGSSYMGEAHVSDALESTPLEEPEQPEDKKLFIPKDKDEDLTQKLINKEDISSDDLSGEEKVLAKDVEADEREEIEREHKAKQVPTTEAPNKETEEPAVTKPPAHTESKTKEKTPPSPSLSSPKTTSAHNEHPSIPPRPVVPKRPSSSSSGRTATPEPVSAETKQQQPSKSTTGEKPKVAAKPPRQNKFSSARAAFVANLESRLGKGPVPAPPPKPRHAVPTTTTTTAPETNTSTGGVGLAYPTSFTGSRRSTTESASEDGLGSADLRRGRARGPKGRRLPTSQGISVDGLKVAPAEPLWEIDNQGDLVFEGNTLQHPVVKEESTPPIESDTSTEQGSDIEENQQAAEPTDRKLPPSFTATGSSDDLEEPIVANKEQIDANGATDSGYVSDGDD